MAIQQQVHNRFKVFVGSSFAELAGKVAGFTADGSIAAKSIGVELVEFSGQFVLSLGFADGQEGYAVKLSEASVGSYSDVSSVESAMEQAASAVGDVICHEMYVDADGQVHIVFMSKA